MSELVGMENVGKSVRLGERFEPILSDMTLHIESGEYVALTGPSGSGKSTLLNLIGLLDRPTSGQLRLFGQAVDGLTAADAARIRARSIGFVFQSFHLISHMTVRQNMALPWRYFEGEKNPALLASLLERFHLTHRAEAFPGTLSGGERQRVAIARALMNQPPLILADEPTGNLDSKNAQDVLQILEELHQEGRTIVLITHDAALARRAGRIVTVHDGRLAAAA